MQTLEREAWRGGRVVKILSRAVLLTSLIWLGGCRAQSAVDPAPADPPSLWSIAVVERDGEIGRASCRERVLVTV